MRKRAERVLLAGILVASLAAPVAASQSAAATPVPVSGQDCPAGPAVTVTTVGLSGFAGIFAGYAHSHPKGSTTDWIGGDTDYSVALPGGRHLWDFTDAQLGTIAATTDAILTSGTSHNVAVIESPGYGPITATLHSSKVYAGSDNWYVGWIPEPASAAGTTLHTPFYNPLAMEVEPAKPGSDTDVLRVTGIFGDYSANSENFVATFSLPGLSLEQIVRFPAPQQATNDLGITWGDALIRRGGWTYVYGRSNPQPTSADPLNFVASAYLARVPSGDLNLPAKWQYFTGLASGSPQWASGAGAPAKASPVIAAGGTYPCERGVVPAGAGYSAARLGTAYYVFTRDPNAIGSVTAYSASQPWGPFSGPDEQDQAQGGFGFYTPPVPAGAGSCSAGCTYGPHIQADYPENSTGWLLSYDVNSGTLAARDANASLYWPRYLRIQVAPAPAGSGAVIAGRAG
jgi:hypothetical protein